jgi:DNA-directed RNA polymerase alpha subunit
MTKEKLIKIKCDKCQKYFKIKKNLYNPFDSFYLCTLCEECEKEEKNKSIGNNEWMRTKNEIQTMLEKIIKKKKEVENKYDLIYTELIGQEKALNWILRLLTTKELLNK